MKAVRIAAFVALLAGVVSFVGVGRPEGAGGKAAASSSSGRTITVTGSGSVSTVPDRALFSFGVTSTGTTATQALNANATEMGRVIAAIKASRVTPADIQTQSVSLNPRYTPNGDAIIGYVASNTVSATLRVLDKAGAVVDAAVAAGANQVFGPSLTRSDQTALYQQALRAAVANARGKALAIAKASKVRLGQVKSVVEGGGGPVPVPVAGRAEAPSTTPIEPGTQLVQATVTVDFSVS